MSNPVRSNKVSEPTSAHIAFSYRDPALVLARKQDLASGCLGCAMRLVNKKQLPHKPYCNAAQPMFPHGDKQTCGWWRAQGGR